MDESARILINLTVITIILTIIGIIISSGIAIFLYKKNNQDNAFFHEDFKENDRINNVKNEYIKIVRAGRATDIAALILAGISTLQSEDEAKKVIEQIANFQNKRSPLSNHKNAIEEVGILRFFRSFTYKDYTAGKFDVTIEKLRKS